MAPDVKLKVEFLGFGNVEVEGGCCDEKTVREVFIKFTPSHLQCDVKGWMIKITQDGNCYVQEMKTRDGEEEIGIGIS